jgi:hypothetical protein
MCHVETASLGRVSVRLFRLGKDSKDPLPISMPFKLVSLFFPLFFRLAQAQLKEGLGRNEFLARVTRRQTSGHVKDS